jgi:hypothetical protein
MVLIFKVSVSWGSLVWSIVMTVPSCHSMVRIQAASLILSDLES